MRNINKKAVSGVVTTVLLVLIGVVAVSSFTLIIKYAIQKPMMSPEFSCADFKLSNPIKLEDACYNKEKNLIEAKVRRTFDKISLESLSFALSSDEKARQWLCSKSCSDCEILKEGEVKTYYFYEPLLPKSPYLSLHAGQCLAGKIEIKPCK